MSPTAYQRYAVITSSLLLWAGTARAQNVAELTAARASARESVAAYRAQDWKTFDERLTAALTIQPRHPVWLYNLACAAGLLGDHTRALALLDTIASLGYTFDAQTDDDFARLRSDTAFHARVAKLAGNRSRVGSSEPAVALPGPDFLPEGIAYDARDRAVFLSSVHERKIVRIEAGKTRTLADSTAGLWSVLGIAFAPRTGSLWAVTSAFREMAGHTPGAKGTALIELDGKTGAVRRRITPPGDGHSFNDLTVDAATGFVYVSDPGTGSIYEFSEAGGLREVVPPGVIYSPSGLALMPGTNWLYVADYSVGIVRVSRVSGTVERLSEGPGVSTYGTDGLVSFGRDLVAIQNAVQPHRVVRLALDAFGTRITRLDVLERASPYFDEPTLGVVAGDALLYVANSRWGRFREGRYAGPADGSGPVVLRLPLARHR